MNKTETKQFTAQLYSVTGQSFVCPHNAPKEGETVIAFEPRQKVDPLNVFSFVVTKDRGSVSMNRKFMKRKGKKLTLSYERPMFATHSQETVLKINIMEKYLQQLEK